MKIDVTLILLDHWRTLYNAKSGRLSRTDIAIFYILPTLFGVAAYHFGFKVANESYNVSVTFFGIFIALLLNIQVAIFSVFQRKRIAPHDQRQSDFQAKEIETRRVLLKELNSNISYLILVSCVALVFFLCVYVLQLIEGIAPSIALAIYAHFILTFVMITKRAHVLFQKEYSSS